MPILVSSFQSWTYGEVVNKDEYPDANHCDIPMDTDGTPNIEEFETYLRRRKESFQGFPELCELDCKRHIFILCDPSNPNGAVWPEAKKRHLLQLAQRYKFTIIADTAYHKLIDKSTKEAQGDPMFTRFAHNQTGLVAPLSKKLDFPLFESIPSTKWNNPDRTGCIWSNQTSFRGYVSTNLSDSRNTMALYQENALIHTGIAVKKVCKAFETEKDPLEILTTLLSDQKNFPEINDLTHRNFSPIVHMRLIRALNEMKQVASRSLPQEVAKNKRKYASKLITELKKENRQEKITQIDAQERYKCIAKGIEELAEEFKTSSDPELKTIGENLRERCSSPQAAFYFTLQLGEKSVDSNMKDFLAEIAQKRHIGVVGWEKGLVRFSFGGFLNGEGMDYDLLKLNIKTELRILLTYWQKFTKNREQTRVHSSPQLTVEEAGEKALAELFSGDSETHVAKTLEEKSELVAQLIKQYGKTKTMALLGSHWNADLESYMHKVEADSPITVVNLPSVDCEDVNSLMESELFGNFFNHYLLEVASKIPELQGLTPGQILQNYGFIEFKNYHKSQQIPSHIKPILEKIALEIYQHWHSAKNITFITQPHDSNQSISDRANNLRIAVYKFFGAFVSQQNQPIAENLRDKSIAKMGYTTRRVMASNSLPSWSQKIINQTPMVDKVTSLQDSPSAQEASTTRIAGHDQGIYKRDSEKNARNSEEHRSRLEQFAKEYDPDKYTLKMMQIGPKRVLLVLNKGFESQLMQDYRLNPQYSLTDIAPEGLDQVNPECIYFMGIPEHVMGSSSKVGYYFDKTASGENLPVGWVTTDMLHEYTGYLKKPALTLVNELVLDMGGLPIHGSAFTITTKDGRTKTVVLGGDSGAGKSETLTAMTEKVIAELGGPDNIQYIDLLAGDMVSLWIDDDGDFSVMGTEQGDFMRMKDIGQNWQERYKYLIDFASSTNLGDANAREMISGLCDIEKFTHLNKVDVLAAVNNSQEPPGGNPYQLVENPAELLTNTFILGERIEKKTSGDQPNLHLSLWGTYQESKLTNG
ncbi:MAG: hypothetical protein UT55_C0090G0001 [Candidatus Peregrinibacteria bacterium GW2011_GWE2_39_6]|nr:MAG: hypothetical protein UT55_C0090G0001 [Candidatus Peregrinibacteria bacterium GW2011_GWE2_39_6]